jgi:hypothetical protein
MGHGWFVFWSPLRAGEHWRIIGLDAAGEEVVSVRWP